MKLLDGISHFLGFQRRTDHLTRMYGLHDLTGMVNRVGYKEDYVTIDNNEFNLYKTTPELFIVINKFATMFSNGRFVVKDWKTNKPIENHELIKLLENPNPLMNRNAWLMDVAVNYCVYGNVFTFMNKADSVLIDYPKTLVNLVAHDLKIKRTGKYWSVTEVNEAIEKYIIETSKDEFTPEQIMHFKGVNPNDPLIGLSPLYPIQSVISNIRGARGFRNVNITKHGALGMLSPEKQNEGLVPLGEEDRKAIEKQYATETHGIFDGQNPFKFARIPVKYQHLAYPIKDSMLFEEVTDGFMKIIDNYGLNENIFSKEKGSTFANFNEGLKSAYQDSIIPFAEKFTFQLNDSLSLVEKGVYVELDYTHIPALKDDEAIKAQTRKTNIETAEKLIELGFNEQAQKIIEEI